MIWGYDRSTELTVQLSFLAIFICGYLIYHFIKKRNDNDRDDEEDEE